MNRVVQISVSLFLMLAFTACIQDDYTGPDPNLPSRTVLVYLGGDNQLLSSTLVSEVEALRKGWTYTGNRCLIYIDPVDDVPRLLSLRGGCQVTPTPYVDTLVVYPEENSASAAVFKQVVEDVVRRQPADSYGLIFTSHASGWLPEGTLIDPTRSIGSDKNPGDSAQSNSEMELADFAAAIPDGQFDFIIFEACLMSGVEVAYELRDKTDYLLASSAEILVPGFVPVFPAALRTLFQTKYTVQQSLQQFAQTYYDYVNNQSGDARSTTLSIIRTESMVTLATQVREILADTDLQISDITSIQHFDRPESYHFNPASPRFFDFLDYIERIASAEQYAAVASAVDEIVVRKAATPTFMKDAYGGFAINRHSGLTTYIEQDCFTRLNESYHKTGWYGAIHKE